MPSSYSLQEVTDWLNGMAKGTLDLMQPNDELAFAALQYLQPATSLNQLSPHFTLAEMTHSDTATQYHIDNTPGPTEINQLTLLTNDTLEGVRSICGDHAVTITSGYRCPELNAKVGGAVDSAHLYGCAADLVIPEWGDPLTVCRTIQPHVVQLGIDQLIYETNSSGETWTHIGRARDGHPRGQCFSIINGATVSSPFPGS